MPSFDTFINKLADVLDKPAYPLFFFVSAILVFLSIATNRNFDFTHILLIYSVAGSVLRYIERDLIGNTFTEGINDKVLFKRIVISIYHILNIVLLIVFLKFLKML